MSGVPAKRILAFSKEDESSAKSTLPLLAGQLVRLFVSTSLSAASLAVELEDLIPFILAQAVYEKLPVKMVVLMLYDTGKEPRCIQSEGMALLVLGKDLDLGRSYDIVVYARNAEASLFVRAGIHRGLDDLWVYEGLSRPIIQRDDEQPLVNANLRAGKTNTIVIFINQLRMKIGVMYGNPETTTGGNALKFYASVRIDIRRIEAIKNGTEIIGNRTRAKIVKNKVAPPFKEAVFDIMYGEGISKWGELVDMAVQLDIIQKSGSWFSIGEERIGQGRDNARKYLMENPETAQRIETQVRENMWKLQGSRAKPPAAPAAKPVDVSADDFSDEG